MSDAIAHTDLAELAFAPLRRKTLAQAAEHGLDILQDDAQGLAVQTYYGRIRLAPLARGVRAEIHAPHAEYLQVLKDSLVAQLAEAVPAPGIRWSDAARPGDLPANAEIMTVAAVLPLDCGFRRVTLAGAVTRFSDAAIHFRLGLPPEGRRPRWPRIGANGATEWPEGADRLHLPVYTARAVDPLRGRLVFDLFEHHGGRATRWGQGAVPGQEVLVTAPGGGGCVIPGEIRGFADETGFPAVARILEANPALRGRITLYTSQNGPAYPLPQHRHVTVLRAPPGSAAQMAEAACAAIAEGTGPYLWFAGESRQAGAVRAAWRRAGGAPKGAYIAGYWQAAQTDA
jgi:NADPH-dependent ferric siderophore reductase